jgi:hypothetical protein
MKYKGFNLQKAICGGAVSLIWGGQYMGQENTITEAKDTANRLLNKWSMVDHSNDARNDVR